MARRGQILVILAVGTLVLIAFTGFALDLAQFLIFRAHLRRTVDAAAMAAASHFRGQYMDAQQMRNAMALAAREVLALNNIQVSSLELWTSIDDQDPTDGDLTDDPPLCDDPATDINRVPDKYLCFPRQRKKVWIRAYATFPTAFIRLFGLKEITVSAEAVGESAAMDVVLVIDISGSLAYGHGADPTAPDHPLDDPSQCNPVDDCRPFKYIRDAAIQFARRILDLPCANPNDPSNCLEQDRLGIVVFSTGWEEDPANFRGTFVVYANDGQPWFRRISDAEAKLQSLKVYDPGITSKEWLDAGSPKWPGVARHYTRDGTLNGPVCAGPDDAPCEYVRNVCLPYAAGISDISTCLSTNLGGALKLAGQVLSTDFRPDALRVVILLTTGVPNATFASPPPDDDPPPQWRTEMTSSQISELPFGYCPPSTQYSLSDSTFPAYGQCRDLDVATSGGQPSRRTDMNDPNFDAEDYAYYYADALGCPTKMSEAIARGCATKGLEALMFAVGIGEEVISTEVSEPGDPPAGAFFLRYVAALGDDADPSTDPCKGKPYIPSGDRQQCGNYYWLRSGSDIAAVFDEIARRIFTRLSH